ncbi:ABC transporter permease, partial [Rhizobium johnstonii]
SMSDVFLTQRNIINVLLQSAGTSLMAIVILFVILTRGIDLSVGSVAALGSLLSSIVIRDHGTSASIAFALLAGGACGLV